MKAFILALLLLFGGRILAQQGDSMLRIAEIEIYPTYFSEYLAILREEAEASVKLEKGVLAIVPLYRKDDSAQIRILEIYADSAAYRSHLKSAHFLRYKTSTMKMIKSLKLVDMTSIDPKTLPWIFKKIPALNSSD